MGSTAYVLINMDLGQGAAVTEALKGIPEITEMYHVYGVYDYIVRIEAKTMPMLKDIITKKIRGINQIQSILTMIVVE